MYLQTESEKYLLIQIQKIRKEMHSIYLYLEAGIEKIGLKINFV